MIFPDQPSFCYKTRFYLPWPWPKKMWVMVPISNSGLINGYKERLWLRLHLIFLQSSLKELSIRERRRKPWTSGVGWVILKDLSLSLSWWNLYSWEISENIHLQPDVQDQHIWMLLALATTLANLPIMNSFLGPLGSLHGRGFGSLGPLKVQDFHLVWGP